MFKKNGSLGNDKTLRPTTPNTCSSNTLLRFHTLLLHWSDHQRTTSLTSDLFPVLTRIHYHSVSLPRLALTHTHTTSSRSIQKRPDPISVAHQKGLPQHPRTKFQHTPTPSLPALPPPPSRSRSPWPGTREAWGGRV